MLDAVSECGEPDYIAALHDQLVARDGLCLSFTNTDRSLGRIITFGNCAARQPR